jgi:hypothetical protein
MQILVPNCQFQNIFPLCQCEVVSELLNWATHHEDAQACQGIVLHILNPSCFTPGEWDPGTHWIRDWISSRVSLNTEQRNKMSYPLWQTNPNTSCDQPAALSSYQLSQWYLQNSLNTGWSSSQELSFVSSLSPSNGICTYRTISTSNPAVTHIYMHSKPVWNRISRVHNIFLPMPGIL